MATRATACLIALLEASPYIIQLQTPYLLAKQKNMNLKSRESHIPQLLDKPREGRKKDNISPIEPLYGGE